MTLVIADRDDTERSGIRWLVTSYRIGFDPIIEISHFEALIRYVEEQEEEESSFHMLFVELEMIPSSGWEMFLDRMSRRNFITIAVTAEAVFERAVQAIQLGAKTLLLKPVSPELLRMTLFNFIKQCKSAKHRLLSPVQESYNINNEKYDLSKLFIRNAVPPPDSLLYVIPEMEDALEFLYSWLIHQLSGLNVIIHPLSDGVVIIFPQITGDGFDFVRAQGHRLIQEWEVQYKGRLTIGAYINSKLQAGNIYEAYQLAKKTLSMRFYRGLKQLLWVHEMPEYVRLDPFLTIEEQRQLVHMLENNDKVSIKSWMYKNFTDFPDGYPDPDILRIRITSVLANLRRFMKSYRLSENQRYESAYHEIFQTILYEPVLFRIVQNMLLFVYMILDAAEKQKTEANYDFIEQAMQYIDKNYSKPTLSLGEVAGYVDRSPNYFSQVFARKKGMTFRQYVNNVRISQAKKMMLIENMSIKEIAYAVGFKDPNYFSRVFKHLTGKTPYEWRQAHENGRQ